MRKQLWVMLLSIVMVVTFMPQMAFAAGASKTAAATSPVTIRTMDQLRTAIEKGKGKTLSFRLGADISGSFSVKGRAHKDAAGNFILDEDGEKIIDTTKVTLDLNGHNIKGSQVNSDGALLKRPTIVIGEHGKLTITGNGTVSSLTNYEIIENYGYCTISGGTYKNPETTLFWNRGIMNIKKGTFEALTRDYAIYSAPNDEDTSLTISGGTFTAEYLLHHRNFDDDEETVLITGGDFAEVEHLVYILPDEGYDTVWSVVVEGGTFSKGCKKDIAAIKKAMNAHEEPLDDDVLEKSIASTVAKMNAAIKWDDYDDVCTEHLQVMLSDYTEELEEYDKASDIDNTLREFMSALANVPTKARKEQLMQQLRAKVNADDYEEAALNGVLANFQEDLNSTWYMDEEEEEDFLSSFDDAIENLVTKADRANALAQLQRDYEAITGLDEHDQDEIDQSYEEYQELVNGAETREDVFYYADGLAGLADTLATEADKKAALVQVRAAYSDLKEEDYSEDIWDEIVARAEEDEESYYPFYTLMTKDELAAWTDIYVKGAADVAKIGEESALEAAKEAAHKALTDVVDGLNKDDYSDGNWADIQQLNGDLDLEDAISFTEIQGILDYQKSLILAVEKDMAAVREAQRSAIGLVNAKVAELENSGKYSKAALDDLKVDARYIISDIQDSDSQEAIDDCLERFNIVVDDTMTIEEEEKWKQMLLEESVDELLQEIKNLPSNPTLAERARILRAQYEYNKLSAAGKQLLSEKDPKALSKINSTVKTVTALKKAKEKAAQAKLAPPAKVTLTKLVKGKKKMTVKFKQVKAAKGYQICYSLKKNFKKGKKYTNYKKVKKYSKKGVTIKKLKKKKTYYVKVRAYKVVSGKTIYGKWSKVKKVKIK